MCASTLAHPKPRTPSKWNCWNGSFVKCLASKMEWICSADMPWMWRIHTIFHHIWSCKKYWFYLWRQKNFKMHLSHLLLTYQGTKITRVVVQCSEAWTKKDDNGNCLCKGENASLQSCPTVPNLICTKKTLNKLPIFSCDSCPEKSWDCYSYAYIGAIPFKQSPYILLKLLPWIDHLDYFPWDNWKERMSLSSLTESAELNHIRKLN